MAPPAEYTSEAVAAKSPEHRWVYGSFLWSGEPYRSLVEANPSWRLPPPGQALEWGAGKYYDTTVARKHPYWRGVDLPHATKDIDQLRQDILRWGYCLVEDALSARQLSAMRGRILEQMEGEQRADIASNTPSGQNINTLVNKGACFVGAIEHDPDFVQAGPLIEQLVTETLGGGWICHSFLANGARPGGRPQMLHQDQGPSSPHETETPLLVNTLFVITDMDDANGGTLLIPGSHRRSDDYPQMPPCINLEARAGTAMLFDGRLWHGTGANRSCEVRYVATMSCIKPWMRQQENWVLSVRPEVLSGASPKLLHRMGFQALTYGGTCEGHGMGASGRLGDALGALLPFRQALDDGRYVRVGELSGRSREEDLRREYTLRRAREAWRARRAQSKL